MEEAFLLWLVNAIKHAPDPFRTRGDFGIVPRRHDDAPRGILVGYLGQRFLVRAEALPDGPQAVSEIVEVLVATGQG